MTKYTVYEISCLNSQNYKKYVGITKDIKQRMIQHQSDCRNESSPRYNLPIYKYIRDNGYFTNFRFIALETIDIDPSEKGKYEKKYFELYGGFSNCLNMRFPSRDSLNYYYDNIIKYRDYYQQNKIKIINYNKERYNKTKNIILEV